MEKLGLAQTKKTKFIFAFISGVFLGFGQAVLMGSGYMAVYILSYIHHKDNWVDMPYGNLMNEFLVLFNAVFSPLSSILEKLCGPGISILISSIIVEISLFLFSIQRNIWAFYCITILSGLGIGISANIPLKNACLYYPKKKGLISACIISLSGVSTAIDVLIGEQLINPNKEGVIDPIKAPYYSEDVSKNVKNYFIFAMIILPIGTILSILFFYKYDPNCENDEKGNEFAINQENGKSIKKEGLTEDFNNENENNQELMFKTSQSKIVKKVLKNYRFWRNIVIGGIMPFWTYFIHASYRPYIAMIQVDTKIIYYLGSILTVTAYLIGPLWAFLTSKFGYQPITKIIGLILCLMTVYFFIFIRHTLFFPFGLIITFSSLVGLLSAFTPHLMTVYGLKYFLTIGGFAKAFVELIKFIAALTSIILSIFFSNATELLMPYKMIVGIGGIFTIIGFILIFFESDDKFNYEDEKEKNLISNIKHVSTPILPDPSKGYIPLETLN